MERAEAIKIIKSARVYTPEEREALETLIPELTESEDDKIRKEIISALKFANSGGVYDKHISYLEKQKEPENISASTMIPSCWEVEQKEQKPVDDKAFEEWIDGWWKHNKVNNPDSYDKGDEIQFDERGFKNFCRGIRNMYAEQKPAEWDDYTKTNLGRAIQIIKNAKGNLQGYQTDDGIYECDKAIECLEHFLYRGLEIEKPAEWSEEEKEIIDIIVSVLGQYIDYKAVSGTGSGHATPRYSKEIAWLKSLRPSWKPSEEQMEALLWCTAHLGGADHRVLAELYEHLKMYCL